MALYIVRPKLDQILRLSLGTRRISPRERSIQVHEVSSLRSADAPQKDLSEAIRDYRGKILFGGVQQTPVTGVQFVDLPDEEGERMRRERSDLLVLRDQPIGLIDPSRPAAAAGAKQKLSAKDRWHLAAVGLSTAQRKKLGVTGRGVTVAVLDTGIDASHPEIDGRVTATYEFNIEEQQTKALDKSIDTDGHGTHVAGLICGKTVGVAPAASVMNGILIPKGKGTLANFVIALEWAALQTEVQIVNISAGIRGWVDGMQSVISDLLLVGVLPVVAIGNEGRNHSRSPGNYAEVVSVGSINRDNKVSSFSSGGSIVTPERQQYFVPDLVAPGEGVFSSVMGGGYEAWDGTSMATPIVSGIAALLIERYRDMTVSDLQEALFEGCQDLGVSPDRQGHGLIRAR
jgi:subtilisin family serine protease